MKQKVSQYDENGNAKSKLKERKLFVYLFPLPPLGFFMQVTEVVTHRRPIPLVQTPVP